MSGVVGDRDARAELRATVNVRDERQRKGEACHRRLSLAVATFSPIAGLNYSRARASLSGVRPHASKRFMPAALRLSPFDLFIDPLLNLQDSRLRALHAYWTGKRAGRPMPTRADVSPGDIVSHLPTIFLIDVTPPAVSPVDFQIRLMGTALNDLFAGDFTGRTLDQGFSVKSASVLAKVLGIVCELRRPLRLHGAANFAQSTAPTEIEAIFLPLSVHGAKVEMAMGELVKRASA